MSDDLIEDYHLTTYKKRTNHTKWKICWGKKGKKTYRL